MFYAEILWRRRTLCNTLLYNMVSDFFFSFEASSYMLTTEKYFLEQVFSTQQG